ncbi:hypothetical protein [Lonepinella sp. BR2474]|uniref:hypothetical protein n=1 Tax=Lonepinella sp. BR2474 TaxID=3434548 RepID=UPI003F6E08A3
MQDLNLTKLVDIYEEYRKAHGSRKETVDDFIIEQIVQHISAAQKRIDELEKRVVELENSLP